MEEACISLKKERDKKINEGKIKYAREDESTNEEKDATKRGRK